MTLDCPPTNPNWGWSHEQHTIGNPSARHLVIFAYLEPGSGSLIVQAILGGLAGVAVAFRAWRSRLRRGPRTDDPTTGSDEQTETPVGD